MPIANDSIIQSPMAKLPSYRSLGQILKEGSNIPNALVKPPVVHEVAGELPFSNKRDVILRRIQNCSTAVLKWGIGVCTADQFHGILVGGSATDDGLGSAQDLSNIPGRVFVYSPGAVRVALIEVRSSDITGEA